jgi:3'-phosphoadenosine 5'-phosphosulfate sulfotransferase (PAPS reductase)/FAD synthetase
MIICSWSAGVTSAVATKLAIEKYGKENVRIIYFKIDSAHKDNERFIRDCEKWYGMEIEQIQGKYKDQFEVVEKTKYVNGANGARCTLELKKKLRFEFEKENEITGTVLGFEFEPKEVNRAIRFKEQYPEAKPIFPLIDCEMTKNEAAFMLNKEGIELPTMYSLGYPNNNCIGCVKGGQGYWNKIRVDFPEQFERMAKIEREIGATCLKNSEGRIYLDELNPDSGRNMKVVMPDCGSFCDLEFTDIIDERVERIIKGQIKMELIV